MPRSIWKLRSEIAPNAETSHVAIPAVDIGREGAELVNLNINSDDVDSVTDVREVQEVVVDTNKLASQHTEYIPNPTALIDTDTTGTLATGNMTDTMTLVETDSNKSRVTKTTKRAAFEKESMDGKDDKTVIPHVEKTCQSSGDFDIVTVGSGLVDIRNAHGKATIFLHPQTLLEHTILVKKYFAGAFAAKLRACGFVDVSMCLVAHNPRTSCALCRHALASNLTNSEKTTQIIKTNIIKTNPVTTHVHVTTTYPTKNVNLTAEVARTHFLELMDLVFNLLKHNVNAPNMCLEHIRYNIEPKSNTRRLYLDYNVLLKPQSNFHNCVEGWDETNPLLATAFGAVVLTLQSFGREELIRNTSGKRAKEIIASLDTRNPILKWLGGYWTTLNRTFSSLDIIKLLSASQLPLENIRGAAHAATRT